MHITSPLLACPGNLGVLFELIGPFLLLVMAAGLAAINLRLVAILWKQGRVEFCFGHWIATVMAVAFVWFMHAILFCLLIQTLWLAREVWLMERGGHNRPSTPE